MNKNLNFDLNICPSAPEYQERFARNILPGFFFCRWAFYFGGYHGRK